MLQGELSTRHRSASSPDKQNHPHHATASSTSEMWFLNTGFPVLLHVLSVTSRLFYSPDECVSPSAVADATAVPLRRPSWRRHLVRAAMQAESDRRKRPNCHR